MRRVSNAVARGVVVVSVIFALAVPAEARGLDDGWSAIKGRFAKIAKVIKSFGDGLSDPRP